MDIAQLIDLFLHLDKHLESVVAQYGLWIYVLLFAIIFIETGLVVMPFLPGDSLLFVCGAIAAIGGLSLPPLSISRFRRTCLVRSLMATQPIYKKKAEKGRGT